MAEQPVLKKGADGKAVKRLQKALAAAGHAARSTATSATGTERAVKAFQAARGLTADGVVGPATWAALGVGAHASGGGGGKHAPQQEGRRLHRPLRGLPGEPLQRPGRATARSAAGTSCTTGRSTAASRTEFKRGITRERALELLQEDAGSAAGEISRSVKVKLTQTRPTR